MSEFMNSFGGSSASMILVGGVFMIYKLCTGSKCRYKSQGTDRGWDIQFGEDSDSEDEDHYKKMVDLFQKKLEKRKTIKAKKLSLRIESPAPVVVVSDSPRVVSEL